MASARPLLTARERAVIYVPALTQSANSFAPASAMTINSFLKYRPLRQPQFNRMASSASSTTTQTSPTPASTTISRALHSSTTTRQVGAALNDPTATLLNHRAGPQPESPPPSSDDMAVKNPLAILSLQTVLRSLAVTTLSSSPLLLPPSLAAMSILAHTTNPILNPDHNPILRRLIKSTFYAQFCAGENATEVKSTIRRLKGLGFSGVIMGYAKEVVLTDAQLKTLESSGLHGEEMEKAVKNEVIPWAKGTLETIRLAEPGDYVALK